MRDHDESHPGVARHGLEQGLQGLKPASRAADTEDGEISHEPFKVAVSQDGIM